MKPGAGDLPVYSAVDVAEAVLQRADEPLNPIVLQKILYYIKAWSLGWGTGPVFSDAMEAWANGPVVPRVYQRHSGQRRVTAGQIKAGAASLDPRVEQIVDNVFDFYRRYSADQLIALTHHDAPWRLARLRDNAAAGERSNARILREDMREYYADRMRDSGASRMPQRPDFAGARVGL